MFYVLQTPRTVQVLSTSSPPVVVETVTVDAKSQFCTLLPLGEYIIKVCVCVCVRGMGYCMCVKVWGVCVLRYRVWGVCVLGYGVWGVRVLGYRV